MAKKKAAAKKAAAKKTLKFEAKRAKKSAAKKPRVWESNRGADRAASAKSASKGLKQAPLIKGLRIPALDNCFGHISDTRAAIARLQKEKADLEQHGHDLMKKHKQSSWEFAGVSATRKQGEEKVIFTTVRDRGPAPATQSEPEQASDDQVEQAAGELEDAIVGDDDNDEEGAVH